jgi:hypothetical protein
MKYLLPLIGGIIVVGGLILGIQLGFAFLMTDSNTLVIAQKKGSSQAETTRVVEDIFEEHNIQAPSLGMNSLKFQAPYSTQSSILDTLKENNIEVYVLTKDNDKDTSSSWRIYNKNYLQYKIQWTPSRTEKALGTVNLSEEDAPSTISTTRKHPIAIVISGSKYKSLRPLINLTVPLNFALEPTSPFALRNAVEAARNWHEILLDIRFAEQFELSSIPFTTALLSDHGMPNTHLSIINTNDIQRVDASQLSEYTGDISNRIWLVNVADYSISEVADWIRSLPNHIQLVRISHWDIAPNH